MAIQTFSDRVRSSNNSLLFQGLGAMAIGVLGLILGGFWRYIGIGLLVGGLIIVIRAISRLQNPGKHPIMKTLKKYGEPDQVANQIDAELANSTEAFTCTGRQVEATITPSWIVWHDTREQQDSYETRLGVLKLDNLIWAGLGGVEGAGPLLRRKDHYFVMLHDKEGNENHVHLGHNKEEAKKFFDRLPVNAPWAIYCFDGTPQLGEFQKQWEEDRQTMIDAVAKRVASLKE